MKNWKKYAFASASLVALAASLAACGNLKGNNQKAARLAAKATRLADAKAYFFQFFMTKTPFLFLNL